MLLLLLIAASSWLGKVNAASKQAGILEQSAATLAERCEQAEAAGRPQALSVIRSENERVQATLARLESRVTALETHPPESP